MGRPKQPLIDRDHVLHMALKILDEEGLEALTVRRLAADLGVNAASFYHHFENKDAILVGAAELALTQSPNDGLREATDWKEFCLRGARQLRDFLLEHPALTSVIVRRRIEGMGNDGLQIGTRRLLASGVPITLIAPLYDSLERFVLGTAVREIAERASPSEALAVDPVRQPDLAAAYFVAGESSEDWFDVCVLGIIDAIEQRHAIDQETRQR